MSVKTFTSTTLSSSDVNTYLANAGLVYVKSQTVGSGVSSVTVSNAFSSEFTNYLIIDSGGSMSSDTTIRLSIGSLSTGYYYFLTYGSFTGSTVYGDNGNNATNWAHAGGGGGARTCYIELFEPYTSRDIQMRSRVRYGTVYGTEIGYLGNTTPQTSFTLTANSGTMTGGTITVYGYRKA